MCPSQQGLLRAQFVLQRFLLLDVGIGADHPQRLAVGRACNHLPPIQYPMPAAIGLAQAELAGKRGLWIVQVRGNRLAQLQLIFRMNFVQ